MSRVRNIAVGGGAGERLRVLTVLVLRHPSILPQIEDPYGRLDLPHPLDEIRDTILDWFAEIGSSDLLTEQNALAALDHEGLGDEARQLIARGVVPSAQAETGGLFNQAPLQQWWHFFGLVNFPAFMREVEQDMQAALANPALEGLPEALMVRLRTLERLRRGEEGDDAD